MKKIFFLIMCTGFAGYAQQQTQFSQYQVNPFIYNPGYTGSQEYADIKMGYRAQYTGLEDAPRTFYAGGHTALKSKPATPPSPETNQYYSLPVRGRVAAVPVADSTPVKEQAPRDYAPFHGLGAYLINDQAGRLLRNGFYLNYAYNMALTKTLRLATGAALGLSEFRSNLTGADFNNPNDPLAVSNNNFYPDLNMGAWLYSDRYFVGVSAAQLFQNQLKMGDAALGGGTGKLNVNYYITAGYKIPINTDWSITPSVLMKYTNPAPTSVDVNARVGFRDKFWAALGYRNQDAAILMFGVLINNTIDFSYAYDYNTSALATRTGGSHEVVIGLRLIKK